jgi:D-alanine-D-alanine ligase
MFGWVERPWVGQHMNQKRTVAILFGGRSAEHEVSLLSARAILKALDRSRFEPVLIGIDKAGRFQLQDEAPLLETAKDLRQLSLGASHGEVALSPVPDHQPLLAKGTLRPGTTLGPLDVVFPVLHGTYGEDGTIQGLLELAGLPYVGAGVLGSSVGMDKDATKRILRASGLPISDFVTLRYHDFRKNESAVVEAAATMGFPCFIKPANAGSSVGVTKVKAKEDLTAALSHAFTFDNKVLCEQAINAREIEVAVLGNDEPIASIPGEIVVTHPDGFYSYDAKYIDADGSHPEIPADLSPEKLKEIQALAVKTFLALDCAGMARIDFFIDRDTGALYINEINTIPGFTAISMYPKMWEASGIGFQELISRLLDLAVERHQSRKRLKTSVVG